MNRSKIIFISFVISTLFHCSYSFAASHPWLKDAKNRLASINIIVNNYFQCMAFQDDNLNFITSKECAEEIQKATQPVQLSTNTGKVLDVTGEQVEESNRVFRLKFEPGQLDKLGNYRRRLCDSAPLDPRSMDCKIGHLVPDNKNASLELSDSPITPAHLILPRNEQFEYWSMDEHPKLVSGNPVFYQGELICIMSSDGRCTPYHYWHCSNKQMLPDFRNHNLEDKYLTLSSNSQMCKHNCEDDDDCRYRYNYKRTTEIITNTTDLSMTTKSLLTYSRFLYCGGKPGNPFCWDVDPTHTYSDNANNCQKGTCEHLEGCHFGCNYANSDEMRCNGMPEDSKWWIRLGIPGGLVIVISYILIFKKKYG